jgi:hypothetical protein
LEAAGGGLEVSLDSKKLNWFKLVDDVFFIADSQQNYMAKTGL